MTDSFAGLVRDGFYDGLTFHRVVPDFVLQGGDPEGNGAGGPGYEVTQAPPESYVYAKGDVAMAKLPSDPAGTAGSQFFIVVSPQGAAALGQPGEPPLYAVVGHVLDEESLATVNRIAALGVGDAPAGRARLDLAGDARAGLSRAAGWRCWPPSRRCWPPPRRPRPRSCAGRSPRR